VKHISIMGRAETEVVDDDLNITPENPVKVGGVAIGAVAGATLGALTGVGLFAVPGLGVLMGAGALVGAIAGFDFGLIGGGIATVLTNIGIQDSAAKKYQDFLQEGKFLLLVNGSHEEAEKCLEILNSKGTPMDLEAHLVAEKVEAEYQEQREMDKKTFWGNPDTSFPLSGS